MGKDRRGEGRGIGFFQEGGKRKQLQIRDEDKKKRQYLVPEMLKPRPPPLPKKCEAEI